MQKFAYLDDLALTQQLMTYIGFSACIRSY